jgi:hypothetical protein
VDTPRPPPRTYRTRRVQPQVCIADASTVGQGVAEGSALLLTCAPPLALGDPVRPACMQRAAVAGSGAVQELLLLERGVFCSDSGSAGASGPWWSLRVDAASGALVFGECASPFAPDFML